MESESVVSPAISFDDFKHQVLMDYKIAVTSRECSLLGRREVLSGKSKFGIFGDGKELPQLAMARVFKNGDFRSGYYRDQTFMMAIGHYTIKQFFAGLYAHTDETHEPHSAGRQMGAHFATHSINRDGSWKNLTEQKNVAADMSSTASQMPRLVGLAQASKMYRSLDIYNNEHLFSKDGNEIAWGTIGNGSTSEGLFWETINAGGVLQVPMIISIWDDDYAISVPSHLQTTKENISILLEGFQRDDEHQGYEIIQVKGWDYVALIEAYERAEQMARNHHVPCVIHVTELTQPQGHSTSGSHERYKSKDRLQWEEEYDCNVQFRKWILESNLSDEEELIQLEQSIRKEVRQGRTEAWKTFITGVIAEQNEALRVLRDAENSSPNANFIRPLREELENLNEPLRKEILQAVRKTLRFLRNEESEQKRALQQWLHGYMKLMQSKFSDHLYSEYDSAVVRIQEVLPTYGENKKMVDGRIILRDNFDHILEHQPEVLIFGEDAGAIGDVNQGLEGLQAKYGDLRVADTGIREPTIIGQGTGMAMRGLRPIAEIQYIDYIHYCLQTLSDDVACLRYRTNGRQKVPLIIRTRGHRLEGIWHSGSPMGGLIHLLRGIHILVPRNMTKAAGFYNTLLQSDEPALVVECLNGYRLKEPMPGNLGEFRTPVGVVETIREGNDITLVSYGATLRLVEEAAKELVALGIEAEIIDVQSLVPFDLKHDILKSIQKTNRLLLIDEDMPGGATGYMLQQLIDEQQVFPYLDSPPLTLSAKPHRPAFGTDGDYFSKPSVEDIVERVYTLFHEVNPNEFPSLY